MIIIEYPNHPHASRRTRRCNAVLMKAVNVHGKSKLVPRKSFLYRSITTTLSEFMQRPGFMQQCEQ